MSRRFFKYFIIIISLFYFTNSYSNESIFYVDINFIVNKSLAGKSIISQIDEINKKNQNIFDKKESELMKEEKKLISQKNILDKVKFDEKAKIFTKKISEYKKNRNLAINKLSKQKLEAQKNLINLLTPILADYADKNSISYLIPKQSIIMGKTELDLTKIILEIFNSKVKIINLK